MNPGGCEDWMDIKYQDALEDELRGLRRRLEADPACGVEELEATLKNLYIMSGADWGGRGEVQNISLDAAIAAHEALIAELRACAHAHRKL